MTRRIYSAENPYPGPTESAATRRLAAALATYTSWPYEVAEDIAVFAVKPGDLVARRNGGHLLNSSRVEVKTYESGARHHILNLTAHGFMGSPTEHNERIRSDYAAPAAIGASGLMLPRPTTFVTDSGLPVALLLTREGSEVQAQERLRHMYKGLERRNGARGWDLGGDLRVHGQAEPSLHAILRRLLTAEDGEEVAVTDTLSVIGNNRAQARQAALGIRQGTQLGHVPSVDGWNPDIATYRHFYRAAQWAPIQASLLRRAWEAPTVEEAGDKRRHSAYAIAREGGRLAVVDVQLLLRVEQPSGEPVRRFEAVVWEANRISHRRQPLEYDPHERLTAEFRALAAAYVDKRLMCMEQADWLAGDAGAPEDEGLGGDPAWVANIRDRRDLAIWKAVFPASTERQRLVRETLGEPSASRTGKAHVQQRLRLVSAAISVGYPVHWSERVGDDLLPAEAIRRGWTVGDDTAVKLLTRASTSGSSAETALKDFITTRGIMWLAAAELVTADRGSIGLGAKTAGLRRRTMSNVRAALMQDRVRALGLFQELVHAAGEVPARATKPREVDEQGNPVVGSVATAKWFQEAFPPIEARSADGGSPRGKSRPARRSPGETLDDSRARLVAAAFLLPRQMIEVLAVSQEVVDSARALGQAGLPEAMSDTSEELRAVFRAVRRDALELGKVVEELATEEADLSDLQLASVEFVEPDDDSLVGSPDLGDRL